MSCFTRYLLATAIAVLLLPSAVGCGGGGSSRGTIRGVLTDGYGSIICDPSATITLQTTGEVTTPGTDGSFSISAEPGSYVLRGYFLDKSAGLLLQGSMNVGIVLNQTLDVGNFEITNGTLEKGWDAYRRGSFLTAESAFLSYLDTVRSAQGSLGSSSAYNGLGWTRGRGLDDPGQAVEDFKAAIDGWSDNVDAWVGLAGGELSSMRSTGGFRFNQALLAINRAIAFSGNYSSDPAHDDISEIDLRAFRALVNFLNGNTQAARSEAVEIRDQVATTGSRAGADAIGIVLAFTQ